MACIVSAQKRRSCICSFVQTVLFFSPPLAAFKFLSLLLVVRLFDYDVPWGSLLPVHVSKVCYTCLFKVCWIYGFLRWIFLQSNLEKLHPLFLKFFSVPLLSFMDTNLYMYYSSLIYFFKLLIYLFSCLLKLFHSSLIHLFKLMIYLFICLFSPCVSYRTIATAMYWTSQIYSSVVSNLLIPFHVFFIWDIVFFNSGCWIGISATFSMLHLTWSVFPLHS